LATGKTYWRLAALLLVLAGALWFMCYCPGAGKQQMTPPQISADALRAHVVKLAGEIGERNTELPVRLAAAADYIEQVWRAQGYAVKRHGYTAGGVECFNLEVQTAGAGPVVLVGAHYDSVIGSPGANDNGTGVAALLELSRVFARETSRAIRFVAFVNEEPPYFETPLQGSAVYARAARQRGDNIRVMISLETIGYFSDAPGSQQFPVPLFKLLYPTRGNYIAFVSDFRSRSAMHEAVRAFRAHTDFPVECAATYSGIPGVGWSDHAPFWREGYRAFMVTDTAPYRYAHYHTEDDTPDKVNYAALARVTRGMAGVLAAFGKGD
jgi:hypothetical protein